MEDRRERQEELKTLVLPNVNYRHVKCVMTCDKRLYIFLSLSYCLKNYELALFTHWPCLFAAVELFNDSHPESPGNCRRHRKPSACRWRRTYNDRCPLQKWWNVFCPSPRCNALCVNRYFITALHLLARGPQLRRTQAFMAQVFLYNYLCLGMINNS